MRSLRNGFVFALANLIALIWSTASIAKLSQIVLIHQKNTPETWEAGFDQRLILVILAAEAFAAICLIAGKYKIGLLVGFLLLSSFLTALVIAPPTPGQSCGCFGEVLKTTSATGVLAHITVLAGLQSLLASLTWKPQPR